MPKFEIHWLSDSICPLLAKNSIVWSDSLQKKLDISINQNSDKKIIIINSNTIWIEDFEFTCLKKIGVSVPFFEEECRVIFEAQFEKVFTHAYIIIKFNNFLDIFNKLISWKNNFINNY